MANWIGKAVEGMKKKGTMGSFSKAAEHADMSTMAFAHKEMMSEKASPSMKKKANFALNAIGSRAKRKKK
jgi:hypothetical protein